MGLYLDFLIMQYKLSTGIKNIDVKSETFTSDFTSWINSRNVIREEYKYFIENMKFNFNTTDCAEIGKGNLDSLVKNLDTVIISPFSSTFKDVSDDRLINASMKVNENGPILVEENEININQKEIPPYVIRTYMTQNPYLPFNIENWENLHNCGKNNIIVGVYGSTSDKDIESKINQLKKLKEKLTDNFYKVEYEISNNNYFYAIGSMRNPVQLVKNLESTKTIMCKSKTLVKKKHF